MSSKIYIFEDFFALAGIFSWYSCVTLLRVSPCAELRNAIFYANSAEMCVFLFSPGLWPGSSFLAYPFGNYLSVTLIDLADLIFNHRTKLVPSSVFSYPTRKFVFSPCDCESYNHTTTKMLNTLLKTTFRRINKNS